MEIEEPSVPKVRHLLQRGERGVYVVNAATHFGLRPSPAALIFLLRKTRVALLIDGIEKMTTMTRLQALVAGVLPRGARVVPRVDGAGSKRDSGGEPARFPDGAGIVAVGCDSRRVAGGAGGERAGSGIDAVSWTEQLDARSCVLLRLGDRRFALAADQVSELVAPSRMFRFAHRTPEIDGVILRRGRVVPVCDVAEKLTGKRLTSRRYYLISKRRQQGTTDWIALPVSGDCELIQADLTPAGPSDLPHVAAWLSHDGGSDRGAESGRADAGNGAAWTGGAGHSAVAGGARMMLPGKPAKILLIDSNVLFAKTARRHAETGRV